MFQREHFSARQTPRRRETRRTGLHPTGVVGSRFTGGEKGLRRPRRYLSAHPLTVYQTVYRLGRSVPPRKLKFPRQTSQSYFFRRALQTSGLLLQHRTRCSASSTIPDSCQRKIQVSVGRGQLRFEPEHFAVLILVVSNGAPKMGAPGTKSCVVKSECTRTSSKIMNYSRRLDSPHVSPVSFGEFAK